jgi:hypothetical protein
VQNWGDLGYLEEHTRVVGELAEEVLQVHLEVDEVLAGAYPYSAAAYSVETYPWVVHLLT